MGNRGMIGYITWGKNDHVPVPSPPKPYLKKGERNQSTLKPDFIPSPQSSKSTDKLYLKKGDRMQTTLKPAFKKKMDEQREENLH
mmetsp:Transcript_33761/g.32827  ORF Transcript_33761/g.32827 Transcript_33761/m.32827 type:complete len:85 (-) Transcript_33761:309-563(-)